jgi:hypothetical protein
MTPINKKDSTLTTGLKVALGAFFCAIVGYVVSLLFPGSLGSIIGIVSTLVGIGGIIAHRSEIKSKK